MEVIPAIDLMRGRVVRLSKGDPKTAKVYDYLGDPVMVARRWEEEGADFLHVIDLDAALSVGRNLETVSKIAGAVSIPMQVGGGIRDFKTAEALLETGAHRVILGTLAFSEPLELARLIQECGDERVVVALDHQDGKVMVEGWRVPTNLGIDEAIPRFLDLQIRKFLVTSVAKDGTLSGPDFRILDKVCAYDGASVMAAGGISSLDDLVALNRIGVEGVVVGKALYEGMFTLGEALEAVKED